MQRGGKLFQIARVIARDLRHRGVALRAGSFDLADDRALAGLLGQDLRYLPGPRVAGYVGWGRRPSGLWANRKANETGLLKYLAEDGFLRGATPDSPAQSYVIDGQGIYYDATAPSDIENLIAEPLTPREEARAKSLIATWKATPFTKYNALPDYDRELPAKYVLLADQVPNDLSIQYGLADADAYRRMLEASLAEWPDHQILIKSHPTARSGHFPSTPDRVQVIREACHPARLIAGADAVYAVTSQLGFEALMLGKPVRTFGMPFYAGWGLTEDSLPMPDRRGTATLEQLAHAALIRYARYVDEAGNEITVEQHMTAMYSLRPK